MIEPQISQSTYLGVGIAALLMVLIISGTIIFASPPDLFMGWVGFVFVCTTPVLVLLAMVWGTEQPGSIAKLPQPKRGIVFTAVAALVGGGIALGMSLGLAEGNGPNPILIQFAILNVVISLWLMPVWETWPFSLFSKNPIAVGIAALIGVFVVGFGFWVAAFDYQAMQGASFYESTFAPSGAFQAWPALIFMVTTAGVIVTTLLFDFWPIEKLSGEAVQPLRGIVGTAYILSLSTLIYWVFTDYLKMDPVGYMVQVPVSIMYGVFVATNIFQFQLFRALSQPLRGLLLLAFSIVVAIGMYQLYDFAAGLYAGIYMNGEMAAGPSGQWFRELWVATAMLGVTFPIIVIVTGFFGFWPFQRVRE